MMAKNFMSNILDELMGRDRDALPTDKPRTPKWDDADVSLLQSRIMSIFQHNLS